MKRTCRREINGKIIIGYQSRIILFEMEKEFFLAKTSNNIGNQIIILDLQWITIL